MAGYQLVAHPFPVAMESVLRQEDGALIPFDEGNRDYQAYLAWLSEGNTPDPAQGARREHATTALRAGIATDNGVRNP
jgi:hypothetical protein